MIVSPVDFQAWAQATGNAYPDTPADKAAATPAVIAWKQQQIAQAQAQRGDNALAVPLMTAGGAGLGLAGLALFNHYRRQGHSEAAAGALAANAEQQVRAAAGVGGGGTAVAAPPPPEPPAAASLRAIDPRDQMIRARSSAYDGPQLRGDDESGPTAAEFTQMGGQLARDQGQYKARTDQGFHDPAIAALDSPEKREAYLATIAEAKGTSSREFRDAQDLIASLETTTGGGVDPLAYIAGKSSKDRFGTATAEEEAAQGGFLAQSRTKSNTSAAANFRSKETAESTGALSYSPEAHALKQKGILVDDIGAGAGPFDADARFHFKFGNQSPGELADYNLYAAADLALAKRRHERIQPKIVSRQASNAYIAHIPSAESTDAYRELAARYMSQPGAAMSQDVHNALVNHSSVVSEVSKRISNGETTYTDLAGRPLSWEQIESGSIPKAVKDSSGSGWTAPVISEYARDKDGRVIVEVLPSLPEGNIHDRALNEFSSGRARGIDPKKASTFVENEDGTLTPYLGSRSVLAKGQEGTYYAYDDDGNVALDNNGARVVNTNKLYRGLTKEGKPIALSSINYLPIDDDEFYRRSGLTHPALSPAEIEDNAAARSDPRFFDAEDQGIKGMQESLPSMGAKLDGGSRWRGQGIRDGNVSDNWVFGRMEKGGEDYAVRLRNALQHHLDETGSPASRATALEIATSLARESGLDVNDLLRAASRQRTGSVDRGTVVPLDLSGFQSELGQGAVTAGARLRGALQDHLSTTGAPVPTSKALLWATALAKEHNTDAKSVLRVASGRSTPDQPAFSWVSFGSGHALGARGRDALDRVYNSLGMHAGANVWKLERMVRSGDIRGAANALASSLPALTQVNGRFLRGASQDEKLNIVAEGLTAGLVDLHTTLEKHPQMAAQFGIGKGKGGFGIDAYIKSYVRDWVTARSLQLDPTGQPTYHVPNDAFELIAYDAHQNGRSVLHELDDVVSGSPNGLAAALKLDRLVSGAQSTKQGDPNTNATNFAQTVFSMPDPDLISTRLVDEAAGDVKLSFGTRRNDDATAGFFDRNPSEQLIDERIEDYGVIGSRNATLQNRIKGIDRAAPDAAERIAHAERAQKWIDDNIKVLERTREDLNRGIILGDNGPVSHGRGIVITSNERGAFLAGDTQGLNTSYREEQVNDENTTPLDRAEDIAFEARLNNQLDPEAQATTAGLIPHGGRSEADRTAAEYASQKLYFKNLGPGSRGAMPAGEAFYPRQALRRSLEGKEQTDRVQQILSSYLPSYQQPSNLRGPGDAGINWKNEENRFGGDLNSYAERRQQLVDLDRRTLHRSAWDDTPTVMPEGWHPSFDDPAIQAGVDGAPRAAAPQVGNTETAARHRAFLEARTEAGMGTGFSDDSRIGELTPQGQLRVGYVGSDGRSMLDAGEVSGLGRRGSTFQQQPLAAAPVSQIANTLAAAGLSPVSAPPAQAVMDQEAQVARAGHIADYMDRLVSGGMRSSADGSRLIFKNQSQMRDYAPPGEALIAARVKGLRARGII